MRIAPKTVNLVLVIDPLIVITQPVRHEAVLAPLIVTHPILRNFRLVQVPTLTFFSLASSCTTFDKPLLALCADQRTRFPDALYKYEIVASAPPTR